MHTLNKKRFNKKQLIIVGIIVALALISSFWYVVIHNGSVFGWSLSPKNSSSNHGTDYTSPSSAQVTNGEKIKSNSLNDTSKTGSSGSDIPPAPTPSTGGKSTVQLTITAINQTNSTLQIRTLISSLNDGGTCALTATKTDAASITQTVNVQNLSNTSTCQGFDIPISQMSKGTWNITINYNSTTLAGSVSGMATVQ